MDSTCLMSPIQCPPLPLDTARAAESVFGRDHPYLKLGESLEILWKDLELSALDSADAFLADSFYPCSLATILQYWEDLTDRQMSQATRTRPELKYALHLPLNFPGIEPLTLCAFRQRILASQVGTEALQGMIDRLSEFANRERSSTDVNQIIPAICLPSRAEIILECMGIALEAVATRDPNWLKANAPAHWYKRYYQKLDQQKIPHDPGEIKNLAETVGNDGRYLLEAIENSDGTMLAHLPEILMLRCEWQRQFEWRGDSLKLRNLCSLFCGDSFQDIHDTSNRREGGGNLSR